MFVRTVVVWHITWSVNSVTHMWGYRNYDTDENSKNNWLVGLIANGEGWHNNHHAQPRAAAHGHKWWEFDVTYLTIQGLKAVGLASKVVPFRELAAGPLGDEPPAGRIGSSVRVARSNIAQRARTMTPLESLVACGTKLWLDSVDPGRGRSQPRIRRDGRHVEPDHHFRSAQDRPF